MIQHILSIDLEDYSPVDIKYGVHKRAEEGEILMIAYSLDYAPPVLIDLASGEELPDWFIPALTDPRYKKKAYNAPYERAYLNKAFSIYSPPEQWECTLVRAAMCGLPLSLDDASKALNLTEKKDPVGKGLIRLFCMPCKPTAANDYRTRNMPWHFPDKWVQFCSYCCQDVVTEQGVDKACAWYTIPAQEHHLWCLNEKKNETGVMVDLKLIDSAIIINDEYRKELIEEGTTLSGLSNVNSPAQLKKWLSEETDTDVKSLNKLVVRQMLIDEDDETVQRILRIRQLMSKSSITKYVSMKKAASAVDSRVRGMIQYYGANRTGRESGRICQPQNYPRIEDDFSGLLDDTRELVKRRDVEMLHMVFDNLSNVLSQLLRPTFIAAPGKEFIVLDFSSIEAIVLGVLSDEHWRVEFFRGGGKIYEVSASVMFHTPIDKVTKNQRQKAKIAELLCGYGGSVGAMERNNDTIEEIEKRIPVKEIPGIVKDWRTNNPNIVQSWWDTDAAAKNTIRTGENTPVKHGVVFGMKKGNLLMKLPSGRCLVYQQAHFRKFYIANIPKQVWDEEKQETVIKIEHVKVGEVRKHNMDEYRYHLNRLGLVDNGTKPGIRETICFWGQDKTWKVIETYGPKLVENLVQAVSRDLLMNAVIKVEEAGYPVILTIHDELVVEVPKGTVTLDEVRRLMLTLPAWASGWPVRAEGFVGDYYQK